MLFLLFDALTCDVIMAVVPFRRATRQTAPWRLVSLLFAKVCYQVSALGVGRPLTEPRRDLHCMNLCAHAAAARSYQSVSSFGRNCPVPHSHRSARLTHRILVVFTASHTSLSLRMITQHADSFHGRWAASLHPIHLLMVAASFSQ